MFQIIFIFFDWIFIKQIYYKLNFIKNSFQSFYQHFNSTSDWLFLENILFHTNMNNMMIYGILQ